MIHVAGFIFTLLLACLVWMFRGVIKQAFMGTTKDISKLEESLTEENKTDEQQ